MLLSKSAQINKQTTRSANRLIVLSLCFIGLSLLGLSACKRRTEEPSGYANLEAAVAANAIAPQIVEELRKTGRVPVLVTLKYELPPLQLNPDRRITSQQEVWLNNVRKELLPIKDALVKRHVGLEPLMQFDSFPIMYLQINRAELLLALLNDVEVLSVAPDMESDYLLTESLRLVRAFEARMAKAGGAGVGVALIDSGVDTSLTSFGMCPTAGATGCSVVWSEDIGANDGALDNVGHGTNMAATVLGVAPSASIVMFDAGAGTDAIRDSSAIAALNRVMALRATFNIRAANMSFGHDQKSWKGFCGARDGYVSVFAMLRNVGIVPVVASGNSGQSGSAYADGMDRPGCVFGAVSVGSVYDSNTAGRVHTGCTDTTVAVDTVPCFSQSHANLTLLAPGAEIDVLRMTKMEGTSFSAALTSGAIASLAALRPAMTVAQIEALLKSHGPLVLDSRNSVARRRLDVLAVLDAAMGPTPDAFEDARTMVGGVSSAEASNFIASKENGEPNHGGLAGGASLWFKWVANYSGPAKIMTAGTNFDHVIAVYTGADVNALTEITHHTPAINTTVPIPGPASVTFNAVAGTTYRIAIDGQTIGTLLQRGTARLTLNGPAANNNLVNAIPLVRNTMTTGLNVGSDHEANEVVHCGNDGGASVWYMFQPPTDGTFTVDTTVDMGTTLLRCVDVWKAAGSTSPQTPSRFVLQKVAGALWATPDDTTTAAFSGTAGTTYFIAVDGISSEQPPLQAPDTGQFSIVVH